MKEIFLKVYNYFSQLIPNIRMWPETTNPSIEPRKSRKIPGRPGKKRRKSKDDKKKYSEICHVKLGCSNKESLNWILKRIMVFFLTQLFYFIFVYLIGV